MDWLSNKSYKKIVASKINFFVDILQVNQFNNNQTGIVFYKNNYALNK